MISPRVSFIVVTHARPQWLSRALESIRRQTIDDREIVVVVNGPDRETQQLLRALDSEVRATFLGENRGVGGGRNAGIGLARGEILFFLDDDAELRNRDAAVRVLAHFESDIDLGVVGLLAIDANTGAVEHRCLPFRDKRLPERTITASYFCGGASAIRRRVFDRVGLFDESLFYSCEELDFSYRVLADGLRILFDPSVAVMHYRAGERGDSTALYFDARNRPWVALRHLPLLCCMTHCFVWWGWSLARGVHKRAIGAALRGIRDCVARMPALWRERRPIARSTRRLLAHNNGRLWY